MDLAIRTKHIHVDVTLCATKSALLKFQTIYNLMLKLVLNSRCS